MNYLKYYNLEDYLFTEVTNAFRDRGYLTPEEFFSIVIWKANRAKTAIKRKLAKRGKNLAATAQNLTAQIHQAASDEERLRIFLSKDWAFSLPMATAVLTVLYPDNGELLNWATISNFSGFDSMPGCAMLSCFSFI